MSTPKKKEEVKFTTAIYYLYSIYCTVWHMYIRRIKKEEKAIVIVAAGGAEKRFISLPR